MAKIDRITPGQVLFDVKRNIGIYAWSCKYSVYPVYVTEVNIEEGYIIASWNHNPPKKMFVRQINKLRVKEPKEQTNQR